MQGAVGTKKTEENGLGILISYRPQNPVDGRNTLSGFKLSEALSAQLNVD